MLLFNRVFLTVGILFPRAMSYMHCITVTLCKCNQSQQHQELCLSRIWAEAAYPCSHEGLIAEASPTQLSPVCQRSWGPFRSWTIDDSTNKEGAAT